MTVGHALAMTIPSTCTRPPSAMYVYRSPRHIGLQGNGVYVRRPITKSKTCLDVPTQLLLSVQSILDILDIQDPKTREFQYACTDANNAPRNVSPQAVHVNDANSCVLSVSATRSELCRTNSGVCERVGMPQYYRVEMPQYYPR